jgi:hypothetical protein
VSAGFFELRILLFLLSRTGRPVCEGPTARGVILL